MSKPLSFDHLYQDPGWTKELAGNGEEILFEKVKYKDSDSGHFLIVKKRISLLPWNYLRITFGPAIDFNSKEVVQFVFKRIIEISKKNNSVYVQVHPFVFDDTETIGDWLHELNFRKVKHYIYKATIMIDLSKTEEEIFNDFERRGKEAVRQSERRGISSSKAEITKENFEVFYKMYLETCMRSGMIPDTKEKIYKIAFNFAEKEKVFLFFANYENRVVSGFLAFKCADCLSLIYQGSDYSGDLANRRPANNLYWSTIRWAKEQGFKWFDLAGVTTDAAPGSKSDGIYLYKRQFGGKLYRMPGNFEHVNRPIIKAFIDICIPVYSRIALFLQRRKMEMK